MSALQRVLFTAGLAVLAFLAWQQTAGAIEVSVTAHPAWNVVEGTQITLSVTVNMPEYPEGTASAWVTLDRDIIAEAQVSVQNGVGTAGFLGNFTAEGYLQCASQGFALPTISVNIHGDGSGPLLETGHESIYCSAQISTTFIEDLVQIPVCGPNNDQITGWDHQPNGTIVDVGFWQEGKRTVSLYPNLNSFAPGTKTSRLFEDAGTPCQTVISPTLNLPTVTRVCGPSNDLITPAESQPEGVNPNPEISNWSGPSRTLIYSTLEGYVFAEGYDPTISVTDTNEPCPVPVLSLHLADDAFVGVEVGDEVTVTATVQLWEGHSFDFSQSSLSLNSFSFPGDGIFTSNHTLTISYTIPVTHALMESCDTSGFAVTASAQLALHGNVFPLTDVSQTVPCTILPPPIEVVPVSPVFTAVCGHRVDVQQNDAYTLIPQEGVEFVKASWGNTTLQVQLRPAEGYVFPQGVNGLFTHLDTLTICEPSALTFDETAPSFVGVTPGDTVIIPAVLTLPTQNPYDTGTLRINTDTANGTIMPTIGTGGATNISYTYITSANFAQECAENGGMVDIDLYVDLTGPDVGNPSHLQETVHASGKMPCDPLNAIEFNADLVVQHAMCGANNDTFTTSQTGVALALGEWVDNVSTLTIGAEEGYYFPDGVPAAVQVNDANVPCAQPTLGASMISGDFVDAMPGDTVTFRVSLALPPAGASAVKYQSAEILLPIPGGTLTSDLILLDGTTTSYSVDFTYTITADTQRLCELSDNEWRYRAVADLLHEDGSASTVIGIDWIPLPCNFLAPVTPDITLVSQIRVCGPNNDTVAFSQDGLTFTMDTWVDNENTVTFQAIGGYYIPENATSILTITDSGPCEVTPDLSGEPVAVCGPDNDAFMVADQPEGVVIDDSGWSDGQRTITASAREYYAIAPGVTTERTLKDEGVPCEVEPEGTQLKLVFATSDQASIEGTSFQILSEMASQSTSPVYAEGVIGANNVTVIEGVLAGEYRLVAEPDGYLPIDFAFNVGADEATQEVIVEVVAVQVAPTPTSPTVEPTATPTSVVTGLPETGAGSGSSGTMTALPACLSIVMAAVLFGNRRFGIRR